jgi:hypothetical protein
MDRHYQLSITSSSSDINVSSIDSEEVSRIVQLAGMIPVKTPDNNIPNQADPVAAVPAEQCAICGANDHDEHNCPSVMSADDTSNIDDTTVDTDDTDSNFGDDSSLNDMRKNAGLPVATNTNDDQDNDDEVAYDEIDALEEEIAEFDHGYNDNDPDGEEVESDQFIWEPSKLPQRIVKGGQGDNPLISELHAHLLSEYSQYLSEADRENEAGVMSPLSDPTKPGFDKDPLRDVEPVDDGSRSPFSTVKRQHAFK